jgi:exoribonuclease R
MRIAKDGAVFHTEVYESIIASDYRFTYKEIDEIIA